MAFSPPTFNLLLDFWGPGLVPTIDPPDVVDIPGQLYYGFRSPNQTLGDKTILAGYPPTSIFRINPIVNLQSLRPIVGGFFKWTDFRSFDWYYQILWWDWDHAEFSNKYYVFCCTQVNKDGSWPCTER